MAHTESCNASARQMPAYSVLLSTYERDNAEWLKSAIQSMLDQTVRASEFVIVKDGPVSNEIDETIAALAESNPGIFKIVQLPRNVGLGLALRDGVLACNNEFIARIDADDISRSDRVEKQLSVLAKHSEIACVGSLVAEFNGTVTDVVARVALPEHHDEIVRHAKKRCPVRHPTLLFRKSAVLGVGNYRHTHLAEDYELVVRMIQGRCRFHNVQEELHWVRVDETFYGRRGGVKYLKSIVLLKRGFRRQGFLSRSEFFAATIPHILVIMMPRPLRAFVYKRFLRGR